MTEWRWVSETLIYAVHDRQLAEHGGLSGIRDKGAVESALARPKNFAAYGDPDAAALAAAYCYGIARNHGFVDGNKRTAWIAARLFLRDNDRQLSFDKLEAVKLVEDVAAGRLTEDDLAAWLRSRLL
jgi:death-on-curing protein